MIDCIPVTITDIKERLSMSAVLARFPKYDTWHARNPLYNINCLLELYTTNMTGEANLEEFIDALKFIFSADTVVQPMVSRYTPSENTQTLLEVMVHDLLVQLSKSQQPIEQSLMGITAWQRRMVLDAQKKKPKINPTKCRDALLKLAEIYPNHPAFKQLASLATEVLLGARLNGREFDVEKQANGSHKITGPKSRYYSSTKEYLINTDDLKLLAFFYGPKLQDQITQAGGNTEQLLADLTQLIIEKLLRIGTKTLYVRDIVTNGPGISYGGWGGVPMSVESRPVEVPEVRFSSDKIGAFVAFFDAPPELAVPAVSSKPAAPAASPKPVVPAVPVVVPVLDGATVADQVLDTPTSPAMTPLADTTATTRRSAGPNTAAKAEVPALDDDMHRDQPILRVDWWGCRFM